MPDEFCYWSAYFGQGDISDPEKYENFIIIFGLVLGIMELTLACAITTYLLYHYCKNNKMERLSWIGLLLIAASTFTLAFTIVDLGKWEGNLSNCNYKLNLV